MVWDGDGIYQWLIQKSFLERRQDKIKERNEIRDEFRQKEREYNAYQARWEVIICTSERRVAAELNLDPGRVVAGQPSSSLLVAANSLANFCCLS